MGLGYFGDDLSGISKALDYLLRASKEAIRRSLK